MKSFIIAAALAGLAAAQNQKLDAAAVAAAPPPAVTQAPVGAANQGAVTYDQDAAASSAAQVQPTSAPAAKMKRAACDPQPAGTAPNTTPDTPEAFQKNPYFHAQANSFPQIIPSGNSFYYEEFRDLNGSTQQNSYLTYYVLDSYSPSACAKKCDSVDLCVAFNIYVERDPSLEPGKLISTVLPQRTCTDSEILGPACPNPKSVANYKCALWGSDVSKQTATNTGMHTLQPCLNHIPCFMLTYFFPRPIPRTIPRCNHRLKRLLSLLLRRPISSHRVPARPELERQGHHRRLQVHLPRLRILRRTIRPINLRRLRSCSDSNQQGIRTIAGLQDLSALQPFQRILCVQEQVRSGNLLPAFQC